MATSKSNPTADLVHGGAGSAAHDIFLVRRAERLIKEKYAKGRHHVACVLICDGREYRGLHVDSFGYDVCAESVAIANALMADEKSLEKIVAVRWDGDALKRPEVIPPCGDCRQLFMSYAPNLKVILKHGTKLISVPACEMLPFPYSK